LTPISRSISIYKSKTTKGAERKVAVTYNHFATEIHTPSFTDKVNSKDTVGQSPAHSYILDDLVGRLFTTIVNEKGEILREEGITGTIDGPSWTYHGEVSACLFEMR